MTRTRLRAARRRLAGLTVAVAALAAPALASAQDFAPGAGAFAQGRAIALAPGQYGHRGGLMLRSDPAVEGKLVGLGPSSILTGPVSLTLLRESGIPFATFTPRTPRPGATQLGPTGLGVVHPGLGDTLLGTGEAGRGIALGYDHPLDHLAQGMDLSLSAGFASQWSGPGVGGGAAPVSSDSFGLGGRIGVSGISLGGALAEAWVSGEGTGPGPAASGGYDLDLTYSFDSGVLSLTRFYGTGRDALGQPTEDPFETLAFWGRYTVGSGLDMMALLAYSDRSEDDPDGPTDGDDWALLTGFRLSF
jgi:hypothetical protein